MENRIETIPYSRESTLCRRVVDTVRRVAQQVIMGRYLSAVREHKADGSLFTEVDLAAQKELTGQLRRILDCPVLGEEMGAAQHLELWQAGAAGLWCIDPIDGTTNFINGLPFFGVSVAHLVEGRPVLGVVYNPAADEAFYAERGGGAFLNGTALPLREPAARLAECVAGVDFKRIDPPLGDRLAVAPPYYSQRNFGCSALEWCYTAAGRLDVYVHGGQMLWDYSAGRLILEEAGGRFCSLTHDDFDGDNLWKRSVVAAANPALFAAWRDWLRAHA